ncbi:aminotransferase class I/II-fold pyridoxal phosphate-dependent enzyme [Candidatus Binatia bacterium]|nr:aminotransferase class I/II-fold pyridoxal phosphate-dependent enzyme [Candidatus Binatia bacterium]
MSDPFGEPAARCAHLRGDNPLRALTEVIAAVPGGINLGQGVCDLDTPRPLIDGALRSIGGEDRQTYTHYSGLPELKSAICAKLRQFNRLDVGDDEVLVASGSSAAFTAAALAVFEPGDEVILLEPFYSYHRSTLTLLGCVPVFVPLRGPSFDLDLYRLRAALGPRTRALVINTPGNPSGKVFARNELEAIAAALAGTRVIVFTDEVYEYMCFDGRQHVSPATVAGLADRTLTIGSFSKTFSITGWRIGYLAGPHPVVEMAGRVFDQMAVCAPRPLQRGVARALRELPMSFYADLGTTYEGKRDRFCAALARAGFRFAKPAGAYYVLADYRDVLGDIEPYAAAMQLIERIGINGVPGDVFYGDPAGVRSLRFQFAVEADVLDEACERFARLR